MFKYVVDYYCVVKDVEMYRRMKNTWEIKTVRLLVHELYGEVPCVRMFVGREPRDWSLQPGKVFHCLQHDQPI